MYTECLFCPIISFTPQTPFMTSLLMLFHFQTGLGVHNRLGRYTVSKWWRLSKSSNCHLNHEVTVADPPPSGRLPKLQVCLFGDWRPLTFSKFGPKAKVLKSMKGICLNICHHTNQPVWLKSYYIRYDVLLSSEKIRIQTSSHLWSWTHFLKLCEWALFPLT